MEVTVYDKVPATADVTSEKAKAYLARNGWSLWIDSQKWSTWEKPIGTEGSNFVGVPLLTSASDWRREMTKFVSQLAELERRQPSAVLADIAREVPG